MQLNTIDLNKLHVFLAVAQRGSVRGAAEQLGRTPSAVSQSLSGLQSQLGTRLVRRIGTKLFLTPEGRRLFRSLETNQRELSQILSESGRQQASVAGTARLGLYMGCPPKTVGGRAEDAMRRHPGLKLRLSFGTHRELAESLAANQIDLALSVFPLRELNRNLLSKKLFEEDLVLVSGSPMKLPATPEAWTQIPVIEYFERAQLFPLWHVQQYGSKKIHAPLRAFAATLDQVLDLVRRGLGSAVVPKAVAVSDSTLKIIPGQTPLLGATWLNVARSNYLSPAARALKDGLEGPKAGPKTPRA